MSRHALGIASWIESRKQGSLRVRIEMLEKAPTKGGVYFRMFHRELGETWYCMFCLGWHEQVMKSGMWRAQAAKLIREMRRAIRREIDCQRRTSTTTKAETIIQKVEIIISDRGHCRGYGDQLGMFQ